MTTAIRKLLLLKQFAKKHPAFPESTLRWLRFHQEANGFESAFLKVGGRVLIDEEEFFLIIEQSNSALPRWVQCDENDGIG